MFYLHVHTCTMCMPSDRRDKRDPLELELQIFLSHHMVSGNQTQPSGKSSLMALNLWGISLAPCLLHKAKEMICSHKCKSQSIFNSTNSIKKPKKNKYSNPPAYTHQSPIWKVKLTNDKETKRNKKLWYKITNNIPNGNNN